MTTVYEDSRIAPMPDSLFRPRGVGTITFRSDRPLPTRTSVDDGSRHEPANDNRPANENNPVQYQLKTLADAGELGVNECENLRNWDAVERLRFDLAVSTGEPLPDVDTADGCDWRETLMLRAERAKQVVKLAADVLGNDLTVLKSVIEDNWTVRMLGENERFIDRASASACGKGLLRGALRNLVRFYDNLRRVEERGDRPPDVWPLVGTSSYPSARGAREYHCSGASYMNQSRNHVVRHPASVRNAA